MFRTFLQRRFALGLMIALLFGAFSAANAQKYPPNYGSDISIGSKLHFEGNINQALVGAKVEASCKRNTIINYSIVPTTIDSNDWTGYYKAATGLTINATTGDLSWTPTVDGEYLATVRAFELSHPNVYDEAYIYISIIDSSLYTPCAEIKFLVKDKLTNLPINDATVSASSVSNTIHNPYGYYYSNQGVNGEYSLNVPKGEYYFSISANGYESISKPNLYINDSTMPSFIEILCGDIKSDTFMLEKEKYLYFKDSINEITVKVGDTIRHQFIVESSNPADVRFDVENLPLGAKIDSLTGEFFWVPTLEDDYFINVSARLLNSNRYWVYTYLQIRVMDQVKVPCATIIGTINNTTTNPPSVAAGVDVTIYSRPKKFGFDPKPYQQTYTSATGQYAFNVPAGDYVIVANIEKDKGKDEHFGIYPPQSINDKTDTILYFTVKCGDSDTININIEESPYLYINNSPKYVYKLNDTVTWKVDVETNRPSDVRFMADLLPIGGTLDTLTGEFKWVANVLGMQTVALHAYLKNVSNSEQYVSYDFVVIPSDLTPCAVIKGYVKDEKGAPIAGAFVQATYPMIWIDNYSDSLFYNYTNTDTNGYYELNLPAGSYWLMASTPWGDVQYYELPIDSTRMGGINLKCGDNITANFEFRSVIIPTYYMISGQVVAENTNKPLDARVTFIALDDSTNCGKHNKFDNSVETDRSGNYEIMIEAGKYKILVEPYDYDYISEFYENKSDFSTATIVDINSNSSYNFQLAGHTTFNNKFFGYLQDSASANIGGMIVGFRVDNSGRKFYPTTVMTNDSNTGYFEFVNVEPGTYYLFAMPNDFNFSPGYYKENAFAVLDWSKASTVTVTDNSVAQAPIYIKLNACSKIKGIAGVKGKVRSNESANGNPLSGVVVVAYDNSGKALTNVMSATDGAYNLNGLAYGDITLRASKLGYESAELTIKLDPVNQSLDNKDLTLALKSATGVEESGSVAIENNEIYPNPVLTSATIKSNDNIVEIRIVDMLGKQVGVYQVNSNTFNLDALNLGTGSYNAILIKNAGVQTLPFQVLK